MPHITVNQDDLFQINQKLKKAGGHIETVQEKIERILGPYYKPVPSKNDFNIVQPIKPGILNKLKWQKPYKPWLKTQVKANVMTPKGLWKPGKVSGYNEAFENIIESLNEPDWNKVGGKFRPIPGWKWHVPPICTRSMATSLQRIFFSGMNILNAVKNYIDSGQEENAKAYLRQIYKYWDSNYFSKLFQRYGQNQNNNTEIKRVKELMEYMFTQLQPKDFLDKFGKFAYNAYFNYKP